jgi:hypothetical protein
VALGCWACWGFGLADVHYVSEKGGNVHPYTSAETAARDIHDALDAAEAGDTVQVLPGTYFTGTEAPCAVGDYVELRGSGPANTWLIGWVVTGHGCRIRGFRLTGGVSLCTYALCRSHGEVSDCVFDAAHLSAGEPGSEVTVRRCVFRNVPGGSSAVSALYTGMTITDCTFDLQHRMADGVFFDELPTPAVMRNCRFTGCRRAISVGVGNAGTLATNCLLTGNDVGILASGRPFRAENCTFYGNGCAVLTMRDLEGEVITNSIIWGNDRGIVEYYSRRDYFDNTWREERAMPVVTFSLLQTNVWWTYPGRGNIGGDPKFFSAEFDPQLHLYSDSPCIDAGDPFSDYSNEPEPNGGRVNMGAYGNSWEATTSELVDVDGDNLRDDWEIEHFGTLDRDGSEDADGDSLSDRDEYRHVSNPNDPDTDGDALGDGHEVFDLGTDPTLADTDNDGTPDGREVERGTDPVDPWDALAIIAFWIEDDEVHIAHPVRPRCWYELQSSFLPAGPFGIVCPNWEGRFGVPAHTFVVDLNPYARFYRIEARPF